MEFIRVKRCTRCGSVVPATNQFFTKIPHGKYGLAAECKRCRKNYDKEHKEQALARSKRWVERHPERRRAANTNWNTKHREKKRQIDRTRYRENPEKERTESRRYRQQNREKERASAQRYRTTEHGAMIYRIARRRRVARQASAPGTFTTADIESQYETQQGLCFWCHAALNGHFHVDHYIPLSRGGTNYPSNIVISCAHCNTAKGTKLPEEFRRFASP